MNASKMPYTGSRLKVRFTVKGDIFWSDRTDKLKANTVQKRLNTMSQKKSEAVGIKYAAGKNNK